MSDSRKAAAQERARAKREAQICADLKKLERWTYASAMTMTPKALKQATQRAYDTLATFHPAQFHSLDYRERHAIADGLYYAALDRGLLEVEP